MFEEYVGKFDTGIFTFDTREEYTDDENYKRDKNFTAKINNEKYIAFKGIDGDDVNFFIVDVNEIGGLKDYLVSLVECFEVSNLTYIGKNDENALVMDVKRGLNMNCAISMAFDSFTDGKTEITRIPESCNGMGKWACSVIAKKHWRNIYDEEI
jgi:hypothetical protein